MWLGRKKRRTPTLKSRLVVVLLLSSLVPLLLLGLVSYYSILSLLQNRVQRGIENNLKVERINLENRLNNLDFASKQLAYGSMGRNIQAYMQSNNYDQYALKNEINRVLENIMYTNPLIGAMFYYIPETNERVFNFFLVKPDVDPRSFGQMSTGVNVVYQAPHASMTNIEQKPVLSVLRKVGNTFTDQNFYVYLETSGDALNEVFMGSQYNLDVTHLLLDDSGKIVYSDKPEWIASGRSLPQSELAQSEFGSHLVYVEQAQSGWKLAVLVKKSDFNREIRAWLLRYLVVATVSVMISLGLALFIRRMLYRPLVIFRKEIATIGNQTLGGKVKYMGIAEFDELLTRFADMKLRIGELLSEVEQKEINRSQVEIEKLLYQINPHFLYNTLNTIQWLALMNEPESIVKLVQSFTRVMNYNLGKEGSIVTVKDEIEALKDYIQLQQIRYNHQFVIDLVIDERTLDKQLPRFILQPLVENALYHGFKDDGGKIEVRTVLEEGDMMAVTVKDNGQGIGEEKLRELLSEEQGNDKKRGLGVGLRYVNNLVKVYYGGRGRLEGHSEEGVGTTMLIRVPGEVKGGLRR